MVSDPLELETDAEPWKKSSNTVTEQKRKVASSSGKIAGNDRRSAFALPGKKFAGALAPTPRPRPPNTDPDLGARPRIRFSSHLDAKAGREDIKAALIGVASVTKVQG